MEFQKNTSNKRKLTSLLFVILLLAIYLIFPVEGDFQKLISQVVFFTLLPLLYIYFILKEKPFVLSSPNGEKKKTYIFISLAGIIFGIFAYIATVQLFDIGINFLIPSSIRLNFSAYLLYEIIFVPFFLLTIGYFLYSFLINEFKKIISFYSILIPPVTMTFLLFYSGFDWKQLSLLIFTPIAAFVAYKTNCFLVAVFSQIVFVFIIDTAILLLVR